jgi:hypothetical protein
MFHIGNKLDIRIKGTTRAEGVREKGAEGDIGT